MKKFSCLIYTFIIPLNFAFAQKLPTGAYHANRERQYDILHYKAELAFDFEKKNRVWQSNDPTRAAAPAGAVRARRHQIEC